MTQEKWLVQPGQSRVIDLEGILTLKIGMVAGQIDVVAHDETGVRIEVHEVTGKDLRIEADGDHVEIDHPQLRWDNFLGVFRHFGSSGPKAEISVAVPRDIALTLGVVSASALVAGVEKDARLNTVSGDIIADGIRGDVSINAVSGDVNLRALTGAIDANSVSGSVTASGHITKADIDTVSGAMLVDAAGAVDRISLNTVSGASTIRLDDDLPANYVIRSVSGRVLVDGVIRSGSGLTSWAGSTGELSGTFADIRVNAVSGSATVLRRESGASEEGAL